METLMGHLSVTMSRVRVQIFNLSSSDLQLILDS